MTMTMTRQARKAKSFSSASLKYLGGIIAPKVASHDVTYLPDSYPPSGISADALNMGGRPFAIDPIRREFVMGTRYGRTVRMQMVEPAEHTDGTANTFPTAPYVTPTMVDLSGQSTIEPNPPTINKSWFETCVPYDTANTSFGGCLPLGDEILLSGQVYYDANNIQRYSAALAEWPALPPASNYRPNRTPFRSIGDPGSQGLVAGYFCPVPEAWRERLKGDVLMGQAALPIISRGSAGPCATSFRASDVRDKQQVPTTLLVGYPQGHWMPGHPWDNPNADEVYNFATMITGMAILGDAIVFVGSHGYGVPCYGDGVSDPDAADGVHYCYDPASSSKSNHAYPYRLQVWHYPLEELAAVAAGQKEPWSLVPDWFELEVPFKQLTHQCNGCAFDPETNRFYVSMYASDGYGYEPGPVIYAWEFIAGAEPPDPPDPPNQDEQIEKLQKTVIALTAALAKERQAHAVLKATVHAEAITIADADVRILKATSPEK
jgi:hypothetical protein